MATGTGNDSSNTESSGEETGVSIPDLSGRTKKLTFILTKVRLDKTPRGQEWDLLNREGKVKEITFAASFTSDHMTEIIKKTFPELENADFSKVRLYKSANRGSDLQRISDYMLDGKTLSRHYANSKSTRLYFRFSSGQRRRAAVVTGGVGGTAALPATIQPPTSTTTTVQTIPSVVPVPPVTSVIPSTVSTVLTTTLAATNPPAAPAVVQSSSTLVSASVQPPTSTANTVQNVQASNVITSVTPSLVTIDLTSTVADANLPAAPAVVQSSSTFVSASVQPPTSTSASPVITPSVTSTLTTGLNTSTDAEWETVGTILELNGPLDLGDGHLSVGQATSQMGRAGEQLVLETYRLRHNMDNDLPDFLSLTFEEVCYQAAADYKLLLVIVSANDGMSYDIARLVSSMSTQNMYFWLAAADTSTGQQVKRKFGNNSQSQSELFLLAPASSSSNPILLDRFSGDSIKDLKVDAIREAMERGAASLVALKYERDSIPPPDEDIEYHLEEEANIPTCGKALAKKKDKNSDEKNVKEKEEKQNKHEVSTKKGEKRKEPELEEEISEVRKRRIVAEPEDDYVIIRVALKNGKKAVRRFARTATYQNVYDWVGADTNIAYFTLHKPGAGSKDGPLCLHSETLKDPEMIFLFERSREEAAMMLQSEVSFNGNYSMNANLSSTIVDAGEDATTKTGEEQKTQDHDKDSADSDVKKGQDGDEGKIGEKDEKKNKKRKRRKKNKQEVESKDNEKREEGKDEGKGEEREKKKASE